MTKTTRYQRQTILEEIGTAGQEKLANASVLCVGAGGLGSPLLQYLAATGIGHLGIIDHDTVELSNLQRQVLFNEKDIGKNKSLCAKQHLENLNSDISITAYPEALISTNIHKLIDAYDIIADCSDNFATRYLVNQHCHTLKKPNVSASIYQFTGLCSIFTYKNSPCYACLFPAEKHETQNCAEAGVLGTLPGLLGTLQANEIIKLITGIGQPLVGKVFHIDTLTMQTRILTLPKNPECHVCSTEQVKPATVGTITANELQTVLTRMQDIQLVDVREPYEHAYSNIGGILIPLNELERHYLSLEKNKPVVVYCKSGYRSMLAAQMLVEQGFTDVKNLLGGIDGFSKL